MVPFSTASFESGSRRRWHLLGFVRNMDVEEGVRFCKMSEKLRIAARSRRETILLSKSSVARVGLGRSKSANAMPHTWMQANRKPDRAGAASQNQKIMPRKRTKLRPDPNGT
jgi:hypothetical protein